MKELDEKTTERLLLITNTIFDLADIQEYLSRDLESEAIRLNYYRYNVKQRINEIKRSTSRLREMATGILDKSGQTEQYNNDCDRLKEVIYNEVGL